MASGMSSVVHGIAPRSPFSPEQLQLLIVAASRRQVAAGSEIFGRNMPRDILAYASSGAIRISKMLRDGRQQIVAFQNMPGLIGRPFMQEEGLTFRAVTPVELHVIPRAVFEAVVDANPAILRVLYRDLSRQLDEARELLLTVGRKSARERVATLLHDLLRHDAVGSNKDRIVELHLTRAEIADLLSLTFETVSRHLAALHREGVVALLDARRLQIRDLNLLRAATGNG